MKFSLFTIFFLVSFSIFTNAQFTVDVTLGCSPLTVQFTDGTGSSTWVWDFGDNTTDNVQNPIHVYRDSGTYSVKLTGDGTDYVRSGLIRVNASPKAEFDTTIVYYASFSLVCSDSSQLFSALGYYVWDFGDGTPADTNRLAIVGHKYSGDGVFPVKHYVVDANGCKDDTTVNVIINHQFIIPNVFTPNGDNVNDRFMVLSNGLDVFPEATFYNRWGNIVYRVQNVSEIIWDGRTFDGSLVSPGAYFYVITPPANSNYQYLDSKLKGSLQLFYGKKSNN